MKNGFDIKWSLQALNELESTLMYLEKNWSSKEAIKLSKEVKMTVARMQKNPTLFPLVADSDCTRRVVVLKLNSIYFRIHKNKVIRILSFFGNRQNPAKRTLR